MLYHLFRWFESLGMDFPGLNLMHYLSFRAILASIFSVSFALIFGKWFVRKLTSRKELLEGEREEDAQTAGQNQKKNTPGFGGVIIIFGILFGVLMFADLTNIYIILLCFSLLSGSFREARAAHGQAEDQRQQKGKHTNLVKRIEV